MPPALTPHRNLTALVTCHTLYVVLNPTWQSAVFLLNSRLTPFTAAPGRLTGPGHPFFRSYGANLPSSLRGVHSRAWVYSTHPPVSVCGTGDSGEGPRGFSGRRPPADPPGARRPQRPPAAFPSRQRLPLSVGSPPKRRRVPPRLLTPAGAGMLTRSAPSLRPFGLRLGPD